MGFKDQLKKLGDNWLIIVLLLVVVVLFSGVGNLFGGSAKYSSRMALESMDYATGGLYEPSAAYYGNSDFAPEVEERLMVRTASLASMIDRGGFDEAAGQLKSIADASDSFVLSENVNRYGKEKRDYRRGSYQLKVPVDKYVAVVQQLREIGTVTSFVESGTDVTGQAVSLDELIAAEKARLERYQSMLEKASRVEDQITLVDRIYDVERTIASLESRRDGLDTRVEYATVSVTLTEEQSSFQEVSMVTLGRLWTTLVDSLSALFVFFFAVVPWVLAALAVWFIVRAVRK